MVTSPYFAPCALNEQDTPEPSLEEVLAKEAARKAVSEEKARIRHEAALERKRIRDADEALNRKLRAERAKANKARGFYPKSDDARQKDREYSLARYYRLAAAKRRAREAAIPQGYVPTTEITGMSPSGLNLAIHAGRIPFVKVGRYYYVEEQAAKEYVAGMTERRRERGYAAARLMEHKRQLKCS